MQERLFGMETEYGLAVRSRDRTGAAQDPNWIDRFMQIATECLPHLPAADGSGFYLPNGARFYMDCGHPEMTTPECANPWDVVRYMHAGERMLSSVAQQLKAREAGVSEVLVFKTNVDHSGAGGTWGCHTSFLHRANPAIFPPQIIPHLVSRIIYTGAGGLHLGANGLRFTLSPRVPFLEKEISGNSTRGRGIFHTKDESLSTPGYHRLHIICGESLCSEVALWLSMGTTALIVAMIEAGLRPADTVQLPDALGAMRSLASDPTCQRTVLTTTGRAVTAVQIQRRYLETAEAHLRDDFMPPWADRVCAQWRTMLDRLENGAPPSVASTLDWAIKLSLFLDRAGRRGVPWDPWTPGNEAGAPPAGPASPPSYGLCVLHQELCEIDTRFGQLGNDGVFSALDRAGVLAQQVPGVDNIEHALAHPPAIGRARLRGECVQQLANQGSRYCCGWRGVWDRQKNLFLNLTDPFATIGAWEDLPRTVRAFPPSIRDHLRNLLGQVLAFHDRGNYEAATVALSELETLQTVFEPGERYEYQRLLAWVQCRRGFLNGIPALDTLAQSQSLTFSLINDYVCVYRYQGLKPPTAIDAWMERGRAHLGQDPDLEPAVAVAFLGHHGYTLMRNGRPEEALVVLEDCCHPRRRSQAHPHTLSRALAELADVHRTLGHRQQALQALDEAQGLQLAHDFEGDLADFALTYRAKLEPDPERARTLLAEAKTIQASLHNRMGEARTLLLEARLGADATAANAAKTRLLELRDHLPALTQCHLLAKILGHWERWTGGAEDLDGSGDFFWWV